MAEILPIRPWRYNAELSKDIDGLVAPLFDVVSERQRQHLYRNPLNSIHLSVPQTGAEGASALLADWKARGILQQDRLYGIYVHYQYFRLHGSPREYCRKGFIAHVRTYPWTEKVILRHENTIPTAVNDRVKLLEETQLHASPTHGLYTDPYFELEPLMDRAIQHPVYETEDYQGVRDVLAVIHDYNVINRFIALMAGKQIILADGHHRYEASIEWMQHARKANNEDTASEYAGTERTGNKRTGGEGTGSEGSGSVGSRSEGSRSEGTAKEHAGNEDAETGHTGTKHTRKEPAVIHHTGTERPGKEGVGTVHKGKEHTGKEGYNFHLMYFTNTEAHDLVILPTHRVIHDIADFDPAALMKKLDKYFIIKEIDDIDNLNDVIAGKQWTYGLVLPNGTFRISLRPEHFATITWPFPDIVKRLDLTVLHYFVIEKVLGIPGKDQRSSPHITFDRNFTDCVTRVVTGKAQAALITNEVSIEDVKRVCASGYTLPQKSTYFYPKIIAGMLFTSIREEEFRAKEFEPYGGGEELKGGARLEGGA